MKGNIFCGHCDEKQVKVNFKRREQRLSSSVWNTLGSFHIVASSRTGEENGNLTWQMSSYFPKVRSNWCSSVPVTSVHVNFQCWMKNIRFQVVKLKPRTLTAKRLNKYPWAILLHIPLNDITGRFMHFTMVRSKVTGCRVCVWPGKQKGDCHVKGLVL